MILQIFSLIACLTMTDAPAENQGVITGTVVNASQGKSPVAGCKVVLRARSENQFVVLAETNADPWGRFQFENLLVEKYCEYQPGANRDGVHYPGPTVQLTPEQPQAVVEFSVCDSVAAPSPLVLRKHEIHLHPEPGILRVTESLEIENPSTTCYVGQSLQEGAEPVTLQLHIPAEFERATFDEEYFGRHFSVMQGTLVTSLPWPPGKKEVKFTYTIRNEAVRRTWRRPLDLPCSEACVWVHGENPAVLAGNVPLEAADKSEKNVNGDTGERVFHSTAKLLPAGYVLSVNLEHLPVPWMVYARWAVLIAFFALMAGVIIFAVRRLISAPRSSSERKQDPTSRNAQAEDRHQHSLHGKHGVTRSKTSKNLE
jgi:hypothetical protein